MTCVDDETDMAALEAAVRGIEKDGLVWGASKLVPVGFGIKKLQINLVVEDEKVSVTDLQEEIEGFEDYVQSSDVVSPAAASLEFPRVPRSHITTGRHAEALRCLSRRCAGGMTVMRYDGWRKMKSRDQRSGAG
jgi:translation elongation factor EF-1beta